MTLSPPAAAHASLPLEVQDLHVRYGRREVLKGVDLEIEPGGVYGLLGPNGAGKTTLIRTICGRVRPTRGEVLVEGGSARHRATLRRVGLVPQEIGLFMHLTVHENLWAFARLSGLSEGEARRAVDWAEEATRLSERSRERIDVLSGGWKRRVNIAAAILHEPALLILDEPTVGVDVDARNELHEVIRELGREGLGVLLATHDLDQAETLCTTVGFLSGGVIGPQGAPQQLVDDVFHGQSQIIVELKRPLTASQDATMRYAGFAPHGNELAWSILGKVEDVASLGLATRLERLGIVVREIRHREPGLDSLFIHLAREGAARAGAAA